MLAVAALLGIGVGIGANRLASRRVSLPDSPTRRISACVICAMAFCAIALAYGPSAETVELAFFSAILLFLSLVDVSERLIPNSCIIAALVVRVLYVAFACADSRMDVVDVGYYVFSACAMGLVLFMMAVVADRLFGSESLGGGDLKLLIVAGLYFGWQQGVLVVMLACAFGLLTSLIGLRRIAGGDCDGQAGASRPAFPFGPAISVACFVAMLAGDKFVSIL